MQKMILRVISAVLIAGSASAANAAHHRHAISAVERAPTSAFRNSNNAIASAAGELARFGVLGSCRSLTKIAQANECEPILSRNERLCS